MDSENSVSVLKKADHTAKNGRVIEKNGSGLQNRALTLLAFMPWAMGAFQTKLDFPKEQQILQRQQVFMPICDKI